MKIPLKIILKFSVKNTDKPNLLANNKRFEDKLFKRIVITILICSGFASCKETKESLNKNLNKESLDSAVNVVLKIHHQLFPNEDFPPIIDSDKCHAVLIKRWSQDQKKKSLDFNSPFKAFLKYKHSNPSDKGGFFSDKDCTTKADSIEITQQEINEDVLVNSAISYLKSTAEDQLQLKVDATHLDYSLLVTNVDVRAIPPEVRDDDVNNPPEEDTLPPLSDGDVNNPPGEKAELKDLKMHIEITSDLKSLTVHLKNVGTKPAYDTAAKINCKTDKPLTLPGLDVPLGESILPLSLNPGESKSVPNLSNLDYVIKHGDFYSCNLQYNGMLKSTRGRYENGFMITLLKVQPISERAIITTIENRGNAAGEINVELDCKRRPLSAYSTALNPFEKFNFTVALDVGQKSNFTNTFSEPLTSGYRYVCYLRYVKHVDAQYIGDANDLIISSGFDVP